ncbi:hypothetical protein [Actinokineospora enzanensis]|nr:hypothetical protein [Actinokineospora enzanensis]
MAGGGMCPICGQRAAANSGDEIKKHRDLSGAACSGEGMTAN